MKYQVDSLTGVVPADQLGTTLIHEHLIVSDPELDLNLPHPEWDEARVAEQLRAQLQQLAALGVDTIVDLTVAGLGRDVQRIASSGWPTTPRCRSWSPPATTPVTSCRTSTASTNPTV